MGKVFHGYLERDCVIVKDEGEASSIYNRSNTGRMEGGKLKLSLVEAFYLMNEGKLNTDVPDEEFLETAVNDPGFQTRYMVYRELRKRGFLIKDCAGHGGSDCDERFMYIWRGGEQREKGEILVFPTDERSPFVFDEIYLLVSQRNAGKRDEKEQKSDEKSDSVKGIGGESRSAKGMNTVFAIVDGDGDVTYYSISVHHPKGPHNMKIKDKHRALLVEDMGILMEDFEDIHALFYGKKIGDGLYLSTLECLYLMEKGALSIREAGTAVSRDSILLRERSRDPDIAVKLGIYSDLRDRGLIVRTGFKYGTHFRVYVRDIEQHAKYLAHAVPDEYRGSWPEISRGVRLAHGVKKDFLLAEASDPPKYLKVKRVRL